MATSCHVGHPETIEAPGQTVRERYGPVDVLVCNAAVSVHYGEFIGVSDLAFEKTFNANLLGACAFATSLSVTCVPAVVARSFSSAAFRRSAAARKSVSTA